MRRLRPVAHWRDGSVLRCFEGTARHALEDPGLPGVIQLLSDEEAEARCRRPDTRPGTPSPRRARRVRSPLQGPPALPWRVLSSEARTFSLVAFRGPEYEAERRFVPIPCYRRFPVSRTRVDVDVPTFERLPARLVPLRRPGFYRPLTDRDERAYGRDDRGRRVARQVPREQTNPLLPLEHLLLVDDRGHEVLRLMAEDHWFELLEAWSCFAVHLVSRSRGTVQQRYLLLAYPDGEVLADSGVFARESGSSRLEELLLRRVPPEQRLPPDA